ncbi:MAG: NADH-quinone oxidoreductase subunit NuoB [Thermaerobacter sp.]|nr:NADH-quinone oxidoreductase subunit NuoB [Thermaerobacter sp.]
MFYPRWIVNFAKGPSVLRRNTAPTQGRRIPPQARLFSHSLAIRHLDAGSCNGCESEISLLSSPVYDLSRFGFSFTPSPRHADLLLVTGVVTEAMVPMIRATYDAMPAPKLVVAAGTCAIDGCVFRGAPGVIGDLERIVPVDVRISGCPPTPDDLLDGLLAAVGRQAPAAGDVG